MEPGFLRSREFAIAGVIALVVMVGGPTGAILSQGFDGLWGGPTCSGPEHGERLAPHRDSGPRIIDGRTERDVAYTITDVPDQIARVVLCTEVGTIHVAPHGNETIEVVVTARIEGAHPDEIDRVRVHVSSAGAPWLSVKVPQAPRDDSIFGDHGGSVRIELRIPVNMTLGHLTMSGDVGDRLVDGVTVGHLHGFADVGNVRLHNVTVEDGATFRLDVGDVTGSSMIVRGDVQSTIDVGDVDLTLDDVGNGSWMLSADVGDVFLRVPEGAHYGYHVDIRTDVGTARAEVGGPGSGGGSARGPDDRLHTETEGFQDRAVQVRIIIRTDVGSGTVLTGPPADPPQAS